MRKWMLSLILVVMAAVQAQGQSDQKPPPVIGNLTALLSEDHSEEGYVTVDVMASGTIPEEWGFGWVTLMRHTGQGPVLWETLHTGLYQPGPFTIEVDDDVVLLDEFGVASTAYALEVADPVMINVFNALRLFEYP